MSTEPSEPIFASPAPPGSLPPADLDAAGPPGRAPATRSRSRTAIAVIAVAVLGFAAAVAALTAQSTHDRAWEPLPSVLDEPAQAYAVQLVLGSCIAELPADGPVHRVQAVPCAEPHEAQVVGRTDAAPDAVWPGHDGAAVRAAARTCGPELLGRSALEAEAADGLRFVVWTPSEASWAAGDRAGLCIAASASPRAGSLLE